VTRWMAGWMAALRKAVLTLASSSPAPALGVLVVVAPVLTFNHYVSLALQWRFPSDGIDELFVPLLVVPVAAVIAACLFEFAPRKAFTVSALLLFTYLNVFAFTFHSGVRAGAYPWRLVTAAVREERDQLLAAARALGIDRKKVLTKAESEALEQRIGPDRVVALPLIGHSVAIKSHVFPNHAMHMTIHWDDGRGAKIDVDTLEIPSTIWVNKGFPRSDR
jgi:hypothetical protein